MLPANALKSEQKSKSSKPKKKKRLGARQVEATIYMTREPSHWHSDRHWEWDCMYIYQTIKRSKYLTIYLSIARSIYLWIDLSMYLSKLIKAKVKNANKLNSSDFQERCAPCQMQPIKVLKPLKTSWILLPHELQLPYLASKGSSRESKFLTT